MKGLQVALCQHCKRERFFCLCLPAACSLAGLCSPGGAAATCLPGACLLLGTPSPPPPTTSLLQPATIWANPVINILLGVRPWPNNTRDQGQSCSLTSPMDLFQASRHAWTQISWKTFLKALKRWSTEISTQIIMSNLLVQHTAVFSFGWRDTGWWRYKSLHSGWCSCCQCWFRFCRHGSRCNLILWCQVDNVKDLRSIRLNNIPTTKNV